MAKINQLMRCMQKKTQLPGELTLVCRPQWIKSTKRRRSLRPGRRSLRPGRWSLRPGRWSLRPGRWSLRPGRWNNTIERRYIGKMQKHEESKLVLNPEQPVLLSVLLPLGHWVPPSIASSPDVFIFPFTF